jgi:hypothetical protein
VYHAIEFTTDFHADFAHPPRHRLERLLLRRGTRLPARLRPHVLESARGPVEAADLLLEDGTVIHDVPFACFRILDRRHGRVARARPARRRAALGGVRAGVLMVAAGAALLLVPLVLASPWRLYGMALLGLAAGLALGAVPGRCRPGRGRPRQPQRRTELLPDDPEGPRDG